MSVCLTNEKKLNTSRKRESKGSGVFRIQSKIYDVKYFSKVSSLLCLFVVQITDLSLLVSQNDFTQSLS